VETVSILSVGDGQGFTKYNYNGQCRTNVVVSKKISRFQDWILFSKEQSHGLSPLKNFLNA
jgi:hypothetical protein